MGSAINIALPSMGKELTMNTISLGWVATAYLLAASLFLLPFGKIADRNGRKMLFLAGIWIFAISALVTGFSVNSLMLITLRFVNGFGAAMIFATALAILTSSYDKSVRGRVLGINVASVYLGLSLGPSIGGFLTMYFGWRSIFYLNALLAAIIIPVAMAKLPSDKHRKPEVKFDYKGTLIYGLSLATIIYGFPLIPSAIGFILVFLGIGGLYGFVIYEDKAGDPLLNIRKFKSNKVFIFSNIAAFINYSATFALVFLLSFYLQQVKHLSPRESGMILMAQPVIMTLLSPIAGRLSDKMEPRIVASLGMALTTLGLAAFVFLDQGSSIIFIILMLVVLGMGFGFFSSPNTNAVMSAVKPVEYGTASATLGTMRLVGQTMSMGITLMVFAVIMGHGERDLTNIGGLLTSIRYAFITFAVLCFLGIFLSLKRGKLNED
jgi:EmrB/QacA subfamily drug resistance transporter